MDDEFFKWVETKRQHLHFDPFSYKNKINNKINAGQVVWSFFYGMLSKALPLT